MRCFAVALVLVLSGTAVAQPALTPPVAPVTPAAPETPHKDEGTATFLALGGTTLGIMALYGGAQAENEGLLLLGLATLAVGPSAGHIYAGDNGHAVKASLVRGGGIVLFGLGAITLLSSGDCIDDGPCDDGSTGEVALWTGGLVFAAATLFDIVDASMAVKRANARHARAWTIAPTPMPASSGTRLPGLSVIGRF